MRLMTTFEDVYRGHLSSAPSPEVAFERLVLKLLRTAPAFRKRFANVLVPVVTDAYPRTEVGDRRGHLASSVDIVAQRHDGMVVAIDCKLASPRPTTDSFIRATENQGFAERVLFTATDIRHTVPFVEPPIEIVSPEVLDALDPPIDWDSLLADEDSTRSPMANTSPPRAAVAQARKHIRAAMDGIRDVTREMEERLDRHELGETEASELQLLRDFALPTLDDLNKRLDDLRTAEVRAWGDTLRRLATVLISPTAVDLLIRAAEALLGI